MKPTTPDQARYAAVLIDQPTVYTGPEHRELAAKALRSLADQVESLTQNLDGHKTQAAEDFELIVSLTADLHAAEVRIGALLCERSSITVCTRSERDSLRAELQIKSAECDLFQRGCDIRDAALDQLKKQEPVEYQLLILGERWTHCAKFLYDKSSDRTIVRALYIAPGAQPAEIEALRADAARYAAKRKEIFLKRNRMQVSGSRSTEEEFNSEYDANCDKAIAGYVADHRGVLVFNSAMVAAKAKP